MTTAPEPVEVEADELAAAEAYWHDVSRRQVGSTRYWGLPLVMAEYDRMCAELAALTRQGDASERAANGFYAHAAAMELQRDEARAELTRTVADCGICLLGARIVHINDNCPRHGDDDGISW